MKFASKQKFARCSREHNKIIQTNEFDEQRKNRGEKRKMHQR